MSTSLLQRFYPVLALPILLCSTFCSRVCADDGTKPSSTPVADTTTAKTTATKPGSGLTEREQLLLDRVEQLEKRVEELEPRNTQEVPARAVHQRRGMGA